MRSLDEIIRMNDEAARNAQGASHIEPIHYAPFDALVMRAQGILQDNGVNVRYSSLADAIYNPWVELARQLSVNDTIELPDGTELKCIWKPSDKD